MAAHVAHTESARSWGQAVINHPGCINHVGVILHHTFEDAKNAAPLNSHLYWGWWRFLGLPHSLENLKNILKKTSKFIVARNPDRWLRASKLATKPRTWMKGIIETCPSADLSISLNQPSFSNYKREAWMKLMKPWYLASSITGWWFGTFFIFPWEFQNPNKLKKMNAWKLMQNRNIDVNQSNGHRFTQI